MNAEVNRPRSKRSPLMNYAIDPKVNEKQFDEFTTLIANLCDIPRALITLIDGEKLWFKSNLGMPVNYVTYSKSYCQFTITNRTLTVFSDTENDRRLSDFEWTSEYPHIKFYAGVPLITEDGIIGTLCIMDSEPRVMTISKRKFLIRLGKWCHLLLESRRDLMGLQEKIKLNDSHSVSLRSMRSITRSW